jgi:isoquinoline 1-oxidoreductase subunit alpha
MVTLTVNGEQQRFDGDDEMPLLWYLRDVLKQTGTKYGCGEAVCGACTVHLDGAAAMSCVVPMRAVNGRAVTTIEGLHPQGMHPLQVAWREHGVPQCGYCQAGQLMRAAVLLERTPHPSERDINEAMTGNICRCGCYNRIRGAIRAAAAVRQGA